jgi:virginiamycin B lyase
MLTEFPLPAHPENPSGSAPQSIAAGPDGALWFTEGTSNRIGRSAVDGRVTEFTLPGADHVASDIVASANEALWFLEPSHELFGRITPQGQITEYAWPCAGHSTRGLAATPSNTPCEAMNITSGSDGAIWFSEKWRNALGRIDGQGHIVEYPLPPLSTTGDGPEALTLGPDGALWFTYCAYTTCAGVGRFSV